MSTVDRSRTAPFLLRVFVRPTSHHELAQFSGPASASLAKDEYTVYAWKDMTMREVVLQLRSVAPNLRTPSSAKYGIRHIFEAGSSSGSRYANDERGPPRARYDSKDLGYVFARDLHGKDPFKDSGKSRSDPSIKTLEQHRFIPGDFLDIAYLALNSTASHPSGNLSSHTNGSIPSLQNRVGLPGSLRPNGPTEADRAWGVAGDQTLHRRGAGRGSEGGVLSGSNRFNPLTSSRGGISILGSAREGRENGRIGERRDSLRDGNEDERMD
ncbi:Histone deacetylase complex subunit sap18 [Cystobasidiomycetes sp. EMM_F5]